MLLRFRLNSLLFVLVASVWIVALVAAAPRGVDFFPLYFAAQRLVAGQSPYGAAATAALSQQWHMPFASAGVAYPLPLIGLLTPLTALSFPAAAVLWTLLGAAGTYAVCWLVPGEQRLWVLPLLFLPFHRTIVLAQATLVWFGLAVALVASVNQRRGWLVALLAALLLLKPQNGLIFAVAGVLWLIWRDRRNLMGFVGICGGLAVVGWLLDLHWISAWLAQVRVYQAVVDHQSVLPWGLVLVIACGRQPWWVMVAAAQVVLFPLSDVYSTLPLLFCWVGVGGWLALLGAAVSWLWPILALPNTIEVCWLLLFLPLLLALVWRAVLPILPRLSQACRRASVTE